MRGGRACVAALVGLVLAVGSITPGAAAAQQENAGQSTAELTAGPDLSQLADAGQQLAAEQDSSTDGMALPVDEAVPTGTAAPASRVQELVDERTATTKSFLLSDGRVEVEFSGSPVHYPDAQGRWQDIDTRVKQSTRSGFAYGTEKNSFASLFGAKTGQLMRLETGGHSITLGVPGTDRQATPKVNGDSITYPDVFGDADLAYTVGSEVLKEEIILPSAPDDPTYTFTLKLGGVEATQEPDGSISFYRKGGSDLPVFTMPKPYMVDSREDAASPYGRAFSDKVTQTVEQRGAEFTITVKADAQWLQSADREYPVVIDPTIAIVPNPASAQDAMILSESPTTNYGSDWKLSVGTSATGQVRSLLKFDLSKIPAGTTIDSAQLKLYYDQIHTNNANDVTIEARRVTAPWSENTVTWNLINSAYGEIGYNEELVDNSDTAKVAVTGSWPTVTSASAVKGGYAYNNDATTGHTFTWVPKLTETGTYAVSAHYLPGTDRPTAAPYTVHYNGGSTPKSVNQTTGSGGVWASLGTYSFLAGSTHKVVLGDVASKRTIADAVKFVKSGTAVKQIGKTSLWHTFSVRSTVQAWLDGTQLNHGFMLKAADETLGKGGPRYEASEYLYNDETAIRPKLVLTYGSPGVTLNPPRKIFATGAQLTWSTYVDPSTSTADNLVEYQVHRATTQHFTPTAATLVAPVKAGTTTFTDTTGVPTPADAPEDISQDDELGGFYYYMVAVKRQDGQIVPSTSQLARLPKAGRVLQILQPDAEDTTVSSAKPTTNLNVPEGQNWLMVGNNTSTYGDTRVLVRFGDLSAIPTNAKVVDVDLQLWKAHSFGSGAIFDVHPLTRAFNETQATWNNATSTTAWTKPGGDFGAMDDYVPAMSEDPKRHTWWIDETLVQNWVKSTSPNYGFLIKTRDEVASQQRSLFLSGEAAEPELRPQLVVQYLEQSAENTYYAPYTPARMIPGDQYPVDVTISNPTSTAWSSATWELTYRWSLPDGTDATTSGNQVKTPLPATINSGGVLKVPALVKTPIQSGAGNKREAFVLSWELRNKTTGQWLSQTVPAIGPLIQNVTVEDPTSDLLGLEQFYQYVGENTGAGTALMVNQYDGNVVWNYDALTNPSRGPATFVRMTYNSFDTSNAAMGYGWSLQTSTLHRLGTPLVLHPPGQQYPTEVTLTDGDGTGHIFSLNKNGSTDPTAWTYDKPAGIHLYLQKTGRTDERQWVMTQPDRTQFFYDGEGYVSAIRDKNGNELLFTYEQRKSNNKPVKFLRYITDAEGRQTLTLDYYEKGQAYNYFDDAGTRLSGTNLTNPKIIDQVESIVDISGRTLALTYSDKGLMRELVDGAGTAGAKTFLFTYEAANTNKNTKLVRVTDPRGHSTTLTYYDAPTDPKDKWRVQKITDRLGKDTAFSYVDPDGQAGSVIESTATDALNHQTKYRMDGYGRPDQIVNAKNETTKLHWDADNNVDRLEEPNGAVFTWTYDQKTGYPTEVRNAEANANGYPGTRLGYQTSLNGYVAEVVTKTTSTGRTWVFGYDTLGNLKTVTDPKGIATTAVPDDYQTLHDYDSFGRLTKTTDANGNVSNYSDYHVVGYPQKITDALSNATTYGYDVRGNVLGVTDANGKTTTQTYDVFGRPLENKVPVDQTAGRYVTTPAPTYDKNDNVTVSTAANGAVTTNVYDDADQLTSSSAPKDTATGPERKTALTYDAVGNVKTVTEPLGTLSTGDPNDYVTSYGYDAIDQLTDVTNALGHRITYSFDNAGNIVTIVDPRKNATADPNDFTEKRTYDRNHAPRTVIDAGGNTTTTDYDRDGNVVATTDAAGNKTELTLDERAKVTATKVPHTGSGTNITYRITGYEYDEVGNRTKVITPRGVDTTNDPDDFAETLVYDQLNRVKERVLPYDRDDARYNTPDKITFSYDKVSRLTVVSAPPSQGQTVRNDTAYSHFDNGWVQTSTDPWDIVTAYDYNELGQQTARTVTSAGGSSSRTMTWGYYPDGKLKSRADDGVPVGKQVVLVDDSDTQNTASTGTWTAGSGGYGIGHRMHAAGAGSDAFTWKLNIPADGTYQVFARYPAVSGAATAATYTVTHNGGSTPKTVNQTTAANTWVSLGTFSFTEGNTRTVSLAQSTTGVVAADAVKLVRDNSADADGEKKDFTYTYDANGNLQLLSDASSGRRVDAYAMSYDALSRLSRVEEKVGGSVDKATSYTYDENGNPKTRTHTDQYAAFEYDVRDLVTRASNGESATDPSMQVSTFGYNVRAELARETKPNGNTVDFTYYLDGLLKYQVEKKSAGTLVAEHSVAYDMNGNRVQDVSQTMSADDHGAYLDRTYAYTFDPRDRIAKVVKTDTSSGATLATETYVHDAANNVISQTLKSVTTTFSYDRNRLVTATTGVAIAGYNYDPFGRLDTVTSAGLVLERYSYDGFDRITEFAEMTGPGSTETTSYLYDPLDRSASRTENVGTATEETTEFAYLGLSNEVLAEEIDQQVSRSYQYSPWGQRLSQIKHNADGTDEASFYGYNAHTDVEVLTDAAGNSRATYGYTAYGRDDDAEFTGVDKPGAGGPGAEPYNVYRFNAKRWDAASGSYDMGFRDYSPGLNRFLSRDSYTGALADLQLTVSPWTGNRYTFAGGNPITGIELDGHRITQCDGPCTQENPGQWENPTTGEIEGSAFDISVQFITHEMVRNAEGPTGSWLTVLHLDSRSFGDFAGNVAILDALLGIPYNATTSRDEAALALWGWKVRQEGDWDHKPDILRIFDQNRYFYMRVPGSSNESSDAEQAISYDLWSNIHYGYVGTDVGFSADVLHDGAKLADLLGNDEISPFDVVAVQLGIDLRYTYEPQQLTAYHVRSAVMSQLPELAEAGGFRHVRPFIPGGPRMEW